MCEVATQFGLPVGLLRREARPAFAHRIAALACCESLLRRPMSLSSLDDDGYRLFVSLLEVYGWNPRELLAQEYRLDHLRWLMLGLAAELAGDPKAAARALGAALRDVKKSVPMLATHCDGGTEISARLGELRALAREVREHSTAENKSDAVAEVRLPSVPTK